MKRVLVFQRLRWGPCPSSPPTRDPPEPPEPPPHSDLDYRQAPPDLKTAQPPPPPPAPLHRRGPAPPPSPAPLRPRRLRGQLHGSHDGRRPPAPRSEGGVQRRRPSSPGPRPPPPPPPPATPALSLASGGGGGPMGVRPEPYPQAAPRPGGMVFAGDKDHRFEYNHSPGEAQPCPLPPHLYNHAQTWGSPSQAGAPPPPPLSLPLPPPARLRPTRELDGRHQGAGSAFLIGREGQVNGERGVGGNPGSRAMIGWKRKTTGPEHAEPGASGGAWRS
ncbi:hypothetical protein N1851_016538 [Merluccius polli]|uniref:Uncharacterized protein n=1 Tax=Merluccius polli TaxID=89951 RepID=A0AA47MQZ2_MERPO|nr:hypothetical protein N1851_016538 [Merluccius polli]